MYKKISQEQIKALIETFYQVNAPVQVYAGVKEMLEKLPTIEEKKDEKK